MTRYGRVSGSFLLVSAAIGIGVLFPVLTEAHCDGLDGPVVKAAQDALGSGDVSLVLIWVRKDDEAEVRQAFERAASVRKLNPEARDLADSYFFETLVRLHRAGEGAPYTGLKPAGRDLGPAIPAADRALATGEIAPLASLLDEAVRAGLVDRYRRVMAARARKGRDVGSGREYVEAYVTFIHYVEGIHAAAAGPASADEPGDTPVSHDHH